MIWSILLSSALACDDVASCIADLRGAARRASTALEAPGAHPDLRKHVLQAYLRYLQVAGEPFPAHPKRLCHDLALSDCPLSVEEEWEKASRYGVRPTIPGWPADLHLAGTFRFGGETGAITSNGRFLRWATPSSSIAHRAVLESRSCALPRAVGQTIWAPRLDRGGHCRTLDVFDLQTGDLIRAKKLDASLDRFLFRGHEDAIWAVSEGRIVVLDEDGATAWAGRLVGLADILDVEPWNSRAHFENSLSIDRTAFRYVLQNGLASNLVLEDGTEWSHPRPCVLASGLLVCIAADDSAVWSAPPESPHQRTVLHAGPIPRGTRLTPHGQGCLVQVGANRGAVPVPITRCVDHAALQGGPPRIGRLSQPAADLPLLTNEDFTDYLAFRFIGIVDLDDPTLVGPSPARLHTLRKVDGPATVVLWPSTPTERAWVGELHPLPHGIELRGGWQAIPYVTVQVTSADSPLGGLRFEWENPWTHRLEWQDVTDPDGRLRVPRGVTIRVEDGPKTHEATAEEGLVLRLENMPDPPSQPYADSDWKERTWAWPADLDDYAELAPDLWTHRTADHTRLLVLGPEGPTVFTLHSSGMVPHRAQPADPRSLESAPEVGTRENPG